MSSNKKRNGYFFKDKSENIRESVSKKGGFLNDVKRGFENVRFEGIDSFISRGFGLLQKGREEQVIECFDKALKIDSENVSVWNNKGVCLLRMDRYQDAIECFEKAIKIHPEYRLAWINKCIALMHLGKKEESHRCFDQAFEICK